MTMRPIDVSAEAKVQPADQPAPRLDWVPIADLVIDETYQRPLAKGNWTAIRKIAGDFSWGRFAPVLVAPIPGGKMAVIDGQHRAHAAALCGFDSVPAMIVPMSASAQAAAFVGVNGQVVRMSGFHVFKAALAAGEEWATAATAAVEAAGCKLMTYAGHTAGKKAGEVYAIATVRKFTDRGQGAVVTRALAAIRATDAGSAHYYDGAILGPWFDVVADFPAHSTEGLTGFCRAHCLVNTADRAEKLRKLEEYRGMARTTIVRKSITALLRAHSKENAA